MNKDTSDNTYDSHNMISEDDSNRDTMLPDKSLLRMLQGICT